MDSCLISWVICFGDRLMLDDTQCLTLAFPGYTAHKYSSATIFSMLTPVHLLSARNDPPLEAMTLLS